MAELKTKATNLSVDDFISAIADEQQRNDSKVILAMMEKISGAKPKMWGSSIVGFVDTHLVYASGRELDWFKIGFSPRKQSLTLYCLTDSVDWTDLLAKLGKHSIGRGCLYIKRLSEVDLKVLEQIIKKSIRS
jgi:hypothetical protein